MLSSEQEPKDVRILTPATEWPPLDQGLGKCGAVTGRRGPGLPGSCEFVKRGSEIREQRLGNTSCDSGQWVGWGAAAASFGSWKSQEQPVPRANWPVKDQPVQLGSHVARVPQGLCHPEVSSMWPVAATVQVTGHRRPPRPQADRLRPCKRKPHRKSRICSQDPET